MARVCLITGGARGIGRATALLAAGNGWDVAIGYRDRDYAASATIAEIEKCGGRAIAVRGDVANEAATIGGRPGSSSYAASKAAVDAFTTGFAKEVAAEGVRVNGRRRCHVPCSEQALGPVTDLVNSAGISFRSRVDALSADQVARLFEVNVTGEIT